MNITVVTTFHKEGLELYGQRFLDSFSRKVDPRIKMIVYAEDCTPNVDDPRIKVLDAKKALPKLNAFKEKWKGVPKANGKCPFPERRPNDHHKAFKWDAVRFANKVYAVFDACEKSFDWVVWMDADSYVHSHWSYEEFAELLPKGSWITYVGRGKSAQSWPECGFYGLNLTEPACKEFLQEFERMYEDPERGIFMLEEWHDSFVFGTILDRMKRGHKNYVDYTAELELKGARTGGGGHPLINTKLGQWIDHMKGDRKFKGHSNKKDMVQERDELYWKKV